MMFSLSKLRAIFVNKQTMRVKKLVSVTINQSYQQRHEGSANIQLCGRNTVANVLDCWVNRREQKQEAEPEPEVIPTWPNSRVKEGRGGGNIHR